jgi:phage protein D
VFTVLAEDALQKARRSRRSATYVNMTPADVVRSIVEKLGLKVNIRDGLDAPKIAHWYQHNESDLAFLRRLLERFDADMQMVGDTLQVGPIAREDRGTIDLVHGDNLIRLRATADLADVAESVRVAGWDPKQGSAADATANDGTLGPGSGRAGKSFVARALDAGQVEHLGTQGQMTQQEADAMARALYGRRARRFVRACGTAQGDPRLRVGTWVNLAGINTLLVTSCTVVEATHRFDQTNGYTTDFVAEGAYMGQPS